MARKPSPPKTFEIEATEYSRLDKDSGLVKAYKFSNPDMWVVVCYFGRFWLWNDKTLTWDLSPLKEEPEHLMSKERALEVLRTTPSKQES